MAEYGVDAAGEAFEYIGHDHPFALDDDYKDGDYEDIPDAKEKKGMTKKPIYKKTRVANQPRGKAKPKTSTAAKRKRSMPRKAEAQKDRGIKNPAQEDTQSDDGFWFDDQTQLKQEEDFEEQLDGESESDEGPNKSPKLRKDGTPRKTRGTRPKLMEWTDDKWKMALLGIVWACGAKYPLIDIPFEDAASFVGPHVTRPGMQQAILKLRDTMEKKMGYEFKRIHMKWRKNADWVISRESTLRPGELPPGQDVGSRTQPSREVTGDTGSEEGKATPGSSTQPKKVKFKAKTQSKQKTPKKSLIVTLKRGYVEEDRAGLAKPYNPFRSSQPKVPGHTPATPKIKIKGDTESKGIHIKAPEDIEENGRVSVHLNEPLPETKLSPWQANNSMTRSINHAALSLLGGDSADGTNTYRTFRKFPGRKNNSIHPSSGSPRSSSRAHAIGNFPAAPSPNFSLMGQMNGNMTSGYDPIKLPSGDFGFELPRPNHFNGSCELNLESTKQENGSPDFRFALTNQMNTNVGMPFGAQNRFNNTSAPNFSFMNHFNEPINTTFGPVNRFNGTSGSAFGPSHQFNGNYASHIEHTDQVNANLPSNLRFPDFNAGHMNQFSGGPEANASTHFPGSTSGTVSCGGLFNDEMDDMIGNFTPSTGSSGVTTPDSSTPEKPRGLNLSLPVTPVNSATANANVDERLNASSRELGAFLPQGRREVTFSNDTLNQEESDVFESFDAGWDLGLDDDFQRGFDGGEDVFRS